jgi:hypothetical protein
VPRRRRKDKAASNGRCRGETLKQLDGAVARSKQAGSAKAERDALGVFIIAPENYGVRTDLIGDAVIYIKDDDLSLFSRSKE